MYPIFRMALALRAAGAQGPLAVGETHISHHICQPIDIDVFMELNNGRTLTLYDLGRFGMLKRMGMIALLKEKRWAGTVAGASVRYRRRVRMFDRIEMRSRIVGWDARFVYCEQSMWRGTECTSHLLLRIAVTDPKGLVPVTDVAKAMDMDPAAGPLPEWVQTWADADSLRPWPPEM